MLSLKEIFLDCQYFSAAKILTDMTVCVRACVCVSHTLGLLERPLIGATWPVRPVYQQEAVCRPVRNVLGTSIISTV
jgi:hypothetical protein